MKLRIVKTALLACGILAGASAVSLLAPVMRTGTAPWLDAAWWRQLGNEAVVRIQPVIGAVPSRVWILVLIGTATLAGLLWIIRRRRRPTRKPATADRRAFAHRLVSAGMPIHLVSQQTGLSQDVLRALAV